MKAAASLLGVFLLIVAAGLWFLVGEFGQPQTTTLGGPVAVFTEASERPPEAAGSPSSAPRRAKDRAEQGRTGADGARSTLDAKRRRHALVNSGYGTSVETATAGDNGEQGGRVSYQEGAPTGELTWEEDVDSDGTCTLTVRVVDVRGQPAVNVFVSLRREEKWETQLHVVGRTDGAGQLIARELPVSYYRASIEDDGALPHTRSWRCDGGNDDELLLEKRKGDTRVFGHVLEEATGQPLADTKLTIQEITKDREAMDFRTYSFVTVNDEGGFDFSVRGGKAWQYRLYASAPGYEFTNADVFVTKGEHRRVTFFLKPFGRIEGQVLLPDGSPAADAKVQQAGNGMLVGVDADADGHFSMAMRHGAQLTVLAHASGAVGRTAVTPPLKEGETRTGLVVQLVPGRSLTGVVTSVDGDPMPLAELIASEPGFGGWLATTQADANGRFVIDSVPPRNVAIFATGSSHRVSVPACAPRDAVCHTAAVDLEVPFVAKQ